MKKFILTLSLFYFVATAGACDICGCGAGNNYIGMLPDFRKHIIGLRYRTNAMLTHMGTGGSATYLTTKETYRTVEAWGGWNLGRHFRVMATVPYSFNEKENNGAVKSKSGLGDITLLGFYQLLNKKNTWGNKLLVQSLWVGGGVKLATGKYNPSDKAAANESVNLFQLGTGSTDFSFGAMYDLRLQDMGININTNYKLNTANKYKYQYGNKFSLNTQLYHKFRVKNSWTIGPNAGVQYERSGLDKEQQFSVAVSGGSLLLGTVGAEASFGPLAIGANFQKPASQRLANGVVKAENRAMIHLALAL